MSDSVTVKAFTLLEKGNVLIDEITFNKITATVVAIETVKDENGQKKKESHERSVMIWRDGHYSCTCTNFLYSKGEHLALWEENVRIKPECKHALAVKLTIEYENWIRMYVVPTDSGYSLKAIEEVNIVHVKSLDEKFSKDKLLPKVKSSVPRLIRGKIPIDKIFSDM